MNNKSIIFVICGVSLALGSLIAIFVGLYNFIAAGLILIGLIGLYVYQAEKMGWFGRISCVLAYAGTVLGVSINLIPDLHKWINLTTSMLQIGEDASYLTSIIAFLSISGVFLLGFVLVGIANNRTKMLPPVSNALIMFGAGSMIVIGSLARFVLCAGLLWQGVVLVKEGIKLVRER